jgi:hypothetical protein
VPARRARAGVATGAERAAPACLEPDVDKATLLPQRKLLDGRRVVRAGQEDFLAGHQVLLLAAAQPGFVGV